MSHTHWNWLGKGLAVVVSLAVVAIPPRMTRAEVGLTWRQKTGWLLPVLLVIAASCALAWTVHALGHEGASLAPEQLLFQATMPGLDEELFYRGVLLALLIRALGPGREVARASFGAAEIAVTLLFAAAHGLLISHGAIAFDATSFIVTGLLGVGLMWLRNRTGSLVIPVLTHNLVNFGECFF
jgi:membrane protease YdiL (CAAX protease family)